MRICITGKMASGKTSVARLLGETLACQVYSLEELIRQAAQDGDAEAQSVLEDNWRLADNEFYARIIAELGLYGPPRWILDGAPLSELQLAGLDDSVHVFVLDAPRRQRIRRLRALARPVAYGVREELEHRLEEVALSPRAIIVDSTRLGKTLVGLMAAHIDQMESGALPRHAPLNVPPRTGAEGAGHEHEQEGGHDEDDAAAAPPSPPVVSEARAAE